MATKKKELLEQEAPVTETVMSEGETLPADTAQPESLPADTGNSLDLNELLGQMDQPLEDTSAEDMAEDPLPELTEEEMFGDTPAETDDQSAAPTDMPEDFDVQPPDVYEDNADAVQEPLHLPSPSVPAERRKKLLLLKKLSQRKSLPKQQSRRIQPTLFLIRRNLLWSLMFLSWKKLPLLPLLLLLPSASPAPSAARPPSLPSAAGMMSRLPKTVMM
ncbi:MAG: hypothetical protein ACLR5X_06765 [Oscillospiraceae bacterium]